MSIIKYLTKLIFEINILYRNIEFTLIKLYYFCGNIIWIVKYYSILFDKFVNLFENIFNFVNNSYIFIINYKAMHKTSQHKNYVQFYNKIKNEKKNVNYSINYQYWNKKSNIQNRVSYKK